jgi:hypothetical protein
MNTNVLSLPVIALIVGIVFLLTHLFAGAHTVGLVLVVVAGIVLLLGGGNYYRGRGV